MNSLSLALTALLIPLLITGCASDKEPTNTGTPAIQKEFYIATENVRPNIGFDSEYRIVLTSAAGFVPGQFIDVSLILKKRGNPTAIIKIILFILCNISFIYI